MCKIIKKIHNFITKEILIQSVINISHIILNSYL